MNDIYQDMVDRWPSSIVARQQVGVFSGGVLTPRYMANLDSAGNGPKRIKFGNRVAYPVRSLAAWLEERSKPSTTRPAA